MIIFRNVIITIKPNPLAAWMNAEICSNETVKPGKHRNSSSVCAIHLFHAHAVMKTNEDIKIVREFTNKNDTARIEGFIKSYMTCKGILQKFAVTAPNG